MARPMETNSTLSTGSSTGNPRNKVVLKAGRSLMDWIRMGNSVQDLAGTGGKIKQVTLEELAKHNTTKDAWICLRGKVYNVTPYMEYHPGGEEELLKGVGQDATAMFNSVHQWVNAEGMLKKCFVGPLHTPPRNSLRYIKASKIIRCETENQATNIAENTTNESCPRWTWCQTERDYTINIEVLPPITDRFQKEDIVYSYQDDQLHLRLLFLHHIYFLTLALPAKIGHNLKVNLRNGEASRVIEVCLIKLKEETWPDVRVVDGSPMFLRRDDVQYVERLQYHRCTLAAKSPINHDTRLFQFQLPPGTRMFLPVGRHVCLRSYLEGVEIARSYTPVSQMSGKCEEDGQKILLMIKIYPLGILTSLLDKMLIGANVDISDPLGNFELAKLGQCHHLGMLAAGTGFTPMVKLMQWALAQLEIRSVKLMFFNKQEKDILWRTPLDELAIQNPKLEVSYILSEPPSDWQSPVGRIRSSLLEEFLPASTSFSDTFVCICGPMAFTKEGLRILRDMKFPSSQIHAFQD